jgi:DNA-binding NarL/FixJ family response regulator
MQATRPTTLLIVNADRSALRGLRMRLELEPDLCVLGEACWSDDLDAIADALAPDVVLMDVDIPAGPAAGLTLLASLAGGRRTVVAVSRSDDPQTALRIRAAGAAALVGKHEAATRLADAIRASRVAERGEGAG